MKPRRRLLEASLAAWVVAALAHTGCGSADDPSPFTAVPDGGGAGGQRPDVTGGCDSDPDCSSGEHCMGGRCFPDQPCKDSLDCTERPNDETVCDRGTGRCVQCVATPDCEAGHECINSACVPFTPCNNSLDCPTGQVCDGARGRCVECVQAADCGMNRVCAGDKCRDRCDSDKDCTPFGLLCDTAGGHCVECLVPAECRDDQHCRSGVCVADVCTAGQKTCQNNAILACSETGDGYGAPVPCGVGQICDPTPNGIECHGVDAGAGGSGGVGGTGAGGTLGTAGMSGAGGTAGGPTDASSDGGCGPTTSTCGSCLCEHCMNEWLACESDPANTATAGCHAVWQCVDQTGCRGFGCLLTDAGSTSPCQPLISTSSSDSLNRERTLTTCVDNAQCPCNRSGGTGGVGGTSGAGGTSGRGGTSGTGGTSGRGGTNGTGGTSGRGGTSGSGGTCNVSSCTNSCIVVTQERCCKLDSTCGCRNVFPTAGNCM